MKSALLVMVLVLFAACNGSGGSGESNAANLGGGTQDLEVSELLFAGSGRWEGYDPIINVEDTMTFSETAGVKYVEWLSRYRGGSTIVDYSYRLEPTETYEVNLIEDHGANGIPGFSATYHFTDEDTVEICSNTCKTLHLVP